MFVFIYRTKRAKLTGGYVSIRFYKRYKKRSNSEFQTLKQKISRF